MTINKRLSLILSELRLNNNSFSTTIGVNATIIHNIIKGRNAPGYDVLNKIALSFDNIDMNWLITGLGNSPFKQDFESQDGVLLKSPIAPPTEPPDCDRCKMKDEIIDSLRQQIIGNNQQIAVLNKLVKKYEDEECPEEDGQKRKAAS